MNEVSPGTVERAKAEAAKLLEVLGAIRRLARRAVRHSLYAKPLPPARSELLRLAARQPASQGCPSRRRRTS